MAEAERQRQQDRLRHFVEHEMGAKALLEAGRWAEAHSRLGQALQALGDEECDLRLTTSVSTVSGIPTPGKHLVIVDLVDHVLHFRIFDGGGKVVVDTDEKKLTEQARQIEDLRKQLESLWPPHELTKSEKVLGIAAVTAIVGPDLLRRRARLERQYDQVGRVERFHRRAFEFYSRAGEESYNEAYEACRDALDALDVFARSAGGNTCRFRISPASRRSGSSGRPTASLSCSAASASIPD